jgi:ribonuclease BN (tRNA processing enzyme)
MSPPSFPITPEGLQGTWGFHALEEGTATIGGFRVQSFDVRHKGGRTFGFRVSDATSSVAYVPDHVVAGPPEPDVDAVLEGVDVLLHDAQFVESERALADAYGHSTVDDAVALATRCGAGELVLFHHGPARTDDAMDAILDTTIRAVAVEPGLSLRVSAAVQGTTVVPGS